MRKGSSSDKLTGFYTSVIPHAILVRWFQLLGTFKVLSSYSIKTTLHVNSIGVFHSFHSKRIRPHFEISSHYKTLL